MPFTLPDLPYPYDALSPYMSRETLEYHHGKHHAAYINALNSLVKDTQWENKPCEDVVVGSFRKNTPLFNNASQDLNHTHFWKWMTPKGGGPMPGALERKVKADFGSVAAMADDFVAAGANTFGSGWCWLALANGKLVVMKTANGESPLVHAAIPLLGCDVWEHSYYIDYRNRRSDYIRAFLEHLVNWEYVDDLFRKAT